MAVDDEKLEGGGTGGSSELPEQPSEATGVSRDEIDRVYKDIDILKTAKTSWEAQIKEINKIRNELKKHSGRIDELGEKVSTYEERIRTTDLRSIEIIGIISAIIALVLVFVDTANAQRTLKDSYLILLTGAASLVLFASLVHHFFNKDDSRGRWYYFLVIIMPILAILVAGYFAVRSF